ncbi:restriction endonuclease subunit S [Photobacterium damselae]|uniref:restriction endonuclease subunit S n=1 Tax=Photobacterium damselae TaxID=38293 RepID=UPI001EFD160D|nr:restriction endonuclease subunit S [Photobacterium damselae]MCG9777592.1 restriction endonuclease subunit S [Photobacterium damselae]
MSELPKGWVSLKLGDLIELKYGKSLPAKQRSGIGFPVYGSNGVVGLHTEALVPGGGLIVGRKGSFGEVHLCEEDFSPIDTTYFVDSFPSGTMKYWYYQLKNLPLTKLNRSTAIPGLNRDDAYAQDVLLPPDAEQKRIVEKLDEVLAQVDTIKARLDGIPAILKRFRQSVLASAVSGKLTEEWRKDNESGCSQQEVESIIESRKTLVTKRMQVPQEHLKNEEYPIPEDWKWVSLDSLSSKIVDGVHHKPEYVDEGVPFMSVKDIKGGKIYFDNCKYVSLETHDEIHPRCNPEKGDLLVTKSGTIGRTAIIKTDEIFDLFVSVALIKPASKKVNMEFINIALMHWVNSIDVSSRVVGTAIKNLHLRDMRVLAVPFAPLTEQKEIVRLVDQYFAFADTIEAQVKKAQARVDNLTQSILAKAFRGELVPQDPNDEPADKLLERISAARKDAEALAKAAKKAEKKTNKAAVKG